MRVGNKLGVRSSLAARAERFGIAASPDADEAVIVVPAVTAPPRRTLRAIVPRTIVESTVDRVPYTDCD